MELTCYVYPGWTPRICAASSRRPWMDDTPDSFAYRCLPLNIANAHGWEILSPCGFEAEWNGGPGVNDVVVRPDAGTLPGKAPVALFGQGVLTFHVDGLLRTSEGFNLWVGGSPNAMKDGIAPLSGLIETDWSPFTFTMNWRFTRPGHRVRFEENEPFCFFFPVERGLVQAVAPRVAPIDEAPELKTRFETWSQSRDAFHASVAAHPPVAPADHWQKFYYRGVDADGALGAPDHCPKLRPAEFAGAEAFHRPSSASPALDPRPPPGKMAWIAQSLNRLRGLSDHKLIPRKTGISADEFLDVHYAANRPVVLAGEMAGWPALERWTPDYLRQLIGSAEVEVQTRRAADPDFERRMDAHSERLPFKTFIDQISRPGAGNDAYLTAYNSARNAAALACLDQDLGFIDKLLVRDGAQPHGMPWIGPDGSFTPLHHDLTNNLLLQIQGRKRLLLVAPSETPRLYNDHHVYSRIRDLAEPGLVDRFPAVEGLNVHQVILGPGDALFIPLGWWHQVTALDFSVTLTHTNFRWPNDFRAAYPGG